MKTKVEKLAELLAITDINLACGDYHPNCGTECSLCPFNSPESLAETVKELNEK